MKSPGEYIPKWDSLWYQIFVVLKALPSLMHFTSKYIAVLIIPKILNLSMCNSTLFHQLIFAIYTTQPVPQCMYLQIHNFCCKFCTTIQAIYRLVWKVCKTFYYGKPERQVKAMMRLRIVIQNKIYLLNYEHIDFTFNSQFIYYLTYLDKEDQMIRKVSML